MQLKALLPSLLLLALRPEAAFAAPEDAKPTEEPVRLLRVSSWSINKRNPFALLMQPHYKALPLNNAESLAKRQIVCYLTENECYVNHKLAGCCPSGTVCGAYSGKLGCCPEGEVCVDSCTKAQTDCGTWCCPRGRTCTRDANGDPACGNDDPSGICPTGYSPCGITASEGCCPTGSKCIPPKMCDVPCEVDDPPCGPNGCCKKGSVCTEDLTCAIYDGHGEFTDLVPTTTTTSTRSRFITLTTRTTTEFALDTSTTEESSIKTTEESSTETTEPSTTSKDIFGNDEDTTTTPSPTTRRVTIATGTDNLAPTMGAMIGNGLGVAGVLLGALVL